MRISHLAVMAAFFPVAAMGETPASAPISDEVIHAWILDNPQVIIDSLTKYEQDQKNQQTGDLADRVAAVRDELSTNAPIIGNPDGDVEIVMFSDYRCPHCRNAHAALEELLAVDDNVRIVIRELPILGDASILAARYALAVNAAVGKEAYEALNKRIFANAADFSMGWLSADIEANGLQSDEILALMDDAGIIQQVQANYNLAQTIGIAGTPFFVINQTPAPGGLAAETMIRAVQEERAKIHAGL